MNSKIIDKIITFGCGALFMLAMLTVILDTQIYSHSKKQITYVKHVVYTYHYLDCKTGIDRVSLDTQELTLYLDKDQVKKICGNNVVIMNWVEKGEQ